MSRAARSARWVVAVAISGTAFIACLAFWLSFTALTQLAIRAGIDARQAWAWPLIVDGCIVVATVAVVALRGRAGSRYAWALLGSGAFVSVTANAIQAAWPPEVAIARWLAAAICSVPPIVLLAITHLTVILARKETPADASTAQRPTVPTATPPVPAAPARSPYPALSTAALPPDRASGPSRSPVAGPVPVLRSPVPTSPPTNSTVDGLPAPAVPGVSLGQAEPTAMVVGKRRTELTPESQAPPSSSAAEASDPRIGEALELREQGLTNKEIAIRLGVSETTIRRWRKAATQQ